MPSVFADGTFLIFRQKQKGIKKSKTPTLKLTASAVKKIGGAFMHNEGVTCSVNECEYHVECNKCRLEKIEVTHEKTSADSMAVPHFCKSYKKKN